MRTIAQLTVKQILNTQIFSRKTLKVRVLYMQLSNLYTTSSSLYDAVPQQDLPSIIIDILYASIYGNMGGGIYRVSRRQCARLRENVSYVKVHRYNQKHLRISEAERLRRQWREKFESMTAVTHLLINKYILKLPGICSFCNVNICT